MDSKLIYTHNLRSFTFTMPNSLRNIILVLTLLFTVAFFWLWPQRVEIISQFDMPDFDSYDYEYEYDDYTYDYEDYESEFYYNEAYGKSLEKWKEEFAVVAPQLEDVGLVCLPETGYYCVDECLDTKVEELLVIETYPVVSDTTAFSCLADDCSEMLLTQSFYDDVEYLEYNDGFTRTSISIDAENRTYSESIYDNDYSAGTYNYGRCYTPDELLEPQQQETL